MPVTVISPAPIIPITKAARSTTGPGTTRSSTPVSTTASPAASKGEIRLRTNLDTAEVYLDGGLPEGAFSKPIAGYLSSPLAPGKKSSTYELEYDFPAGLVVLRPK